MLNSAPIKMTLVPERSAIVITVRIDDVHSLRPFLTYALLSLTGDGTPVLDFTSEAGALQAHATVVAALRNGGAVDADAMEELTEDPRKLLAEKTG